MRNPDAFDRPGPGFRHGPAGCQAATESTFLGAPILSRLCLIDPSIEERREETGLDEENRHDGYT